MNTLEVIEQMLIEIKASAKKIIVNFNHFGIDDVTKSNGVLYLHLSSKKDDKSYEDWVPVLVKAKKLLHEDTFFEKMRKIFFDE